MSDTYICAICRNELEKGISEEEALAQLNTDFPGHSPDECDLVCDDCFKEYFPELGQDGK